MSSPSSSSSSSSSSPSSNSVIPRIRPGDGHITVEFDSHHGHTFTQLSCTCPLRLLSPRSEEDSVAIVYVLSCRGRVESCDGGSRFVDVVISGLIVIIPTLWFGQDSACSHLFRSFSQGSTKVFKDRLTSPVQKPSRPVTCQRTTVRVSKGSTFYLLPDPVPYFKHA